MSRTWQTEEMAVNRKKMAEVTQTLMTSFTKQMTRRGIPNRPDMRSESANEVRNMLVIVLSNFFLRIKKITRPLTATISTHIKDKAMINDTGRNSVCSRSALLFELFPRWLVLDGQDDASSNWLIFIVFLDSPRYFPCFCKRRMFNTADQTIVTTARSQITICYKTLRH